MTLGRLPGSGLLSQWGTAHQELLWDSTGRKKSSLAGKSRGTLLLIRKKEKKAFYCVIHNQPRQKPFPTVQEGLLDQFLELLKG